MPEPIEYRVILSLQAALRAITAANGFFYSVAQTAVKLDPEQAVEELVGSEQEPGPRPFAVLEPLPARWTHEPAQQLALALPVTIHWIHQADQTSDTDWQQVYWRGCADVEQAIAADVERGGLARDTRIVRCTPARRGAEVEAMVEIEVAIHREYGQPNG